MTMSGIGRAAAIIALAITAQAGAAHAQSGYTVQAKQFPGDTFTQFLGINNAGTIAGFHGAATSQGFTFIQPNLFTLQTFPNAASSMATAINNLGDTAGIYVDNQGTTHGYTNIGGSFATVDQGGTVFNQALGINDHNVTVGYSSATDPAGQTGQVAYSQHSGVFTPVALPSNVNSQAVGINNAGSIVGFFQSTPTTSVGFEFAGGHTSVLDPFGSAFTQALGISNTDEIVGFFTDTNNVQHGYTDIGNQFAQFDVAGAQSTVINGVNDQGQLVGFFMDASGNTDGFVATPVGEPASLAMFGVALLGLVSVARQRVVI